MIRESVSHLALAPAEAQSPASPPPMSPLDDALNAARRSSRIADLAVVFFLDPDESPPRSVRTAYSSPDN